MISITLPSFSWKICTNGEFATITITIFLHLFSSPTEKYNRAPSEFKVLPFTEQRQPLLPHEIKLSVPSPSALFFSSWGHSPDQRGCKPPPYCNSSLQTDLRRSHVCWEAGYKCCQVENFNYRTRGLKWLYFGENKHPRLKITRKKRHKYDIPNLPTCFFKVS